MIQEALFGTSVQVPEPKHAGVPPASTMPVVAEPLGPCARHGCQEPATLESASGNPQSIYCEQHGHCGRKYLDRQTTCGTSVEQFVWHERMGIWVCPCMVID